MIKNQVLYQKKEREDINYKQRDQYFLFFFMSLQWPVCKNIWHKISANVNTIGGNALFASDDLVGVGLWVGLWVGLRVGVGVGVPVGVGVGVPSGLAVSNA